MSNTLGIPFTNGKGGTDSPNGIAVSVSPTASSNLHKLLRQHSLSVTQSTSTIRPAKVLHPVESAGELRLLLLENISQGAVQTFKDQGFQVDWFPKAWSEEELLQKIGQYHAIGIRSKTKITEKVIKAANKVCLYEYPLVTYRDAFIAPCHWLLLHRDKPSRPFDRSESRHSCIQLSFLQFTLSSGTRYRRNYFIVTSVM